MASQTLSPDLETTGVLSLLPRELRDRIYSLALNLDVHRQDQNYGQLAWSEANTCEEPTLLRTGLLMTSKRIHDEAKIAFFQTNEFCFWIDQDCEESRNNHSVMGQPGFVLKIGQNDSYRRSDGMDSFFKEIPYEMIPHMQYINLAVGSAKGISEEDIVGTEHQSVFGPEQPTYQPLINIIHDVCALLKSCHQIHMLYLSIRSSEETPGSIEQVIDPIRKLRRIKSCCPIVWNLQDDNWVDWGLCGSYVTYIVRILALPEDVEAPKYVGDEKDPNQFEDKIFLPINGTWLGGTKFLYPQDSDQDSDEDDEGNNSEFFDELAYDDDDLEEDYYDDYDGEFYFEN